MNELANRERDVGGASDGSPDALRPSTFALFMGFLHIGLMGFGGVLPMARRLLVEDKRWLTSAEFNELLALCQFLPGGNIMNLSVAVGMKFRGVAGAAASLTGLLAPPCVIVTALGIFYARFQDDPHVSRLFAGLAAAAAGLLIATALKIAAPLRGKPVSAILAVVCFGAMAILRTPLPLTVAVLVPISFAVTWIARE